MPEKRILIIYRQLGRNATQSQETMVYPQVTCGAIPFDNGEVDSIEAMTQVLKQADQWVEKFIKQFVEFRKSDFWYEYVDVLKVQTE